MDLHTGRRFSNKIGTFLSLQWRIINTLFAIMAVIPPLLHYTHPTDPLRIKPGMIVWLSDFMIILGVSTRIWAAGHLKKNSEITLNGPYSLIRHPLYAGSLLFYMGFFLLLNGYFWGITIFLGVLFFVYFPRMLYEEEYLLNKFGTAYSALVEKIPRLLPNPLRMKKDLRFALKDWSWRQAWNNRGFSQAFAAIFFVLALSLIIRLTSN